MAEPSSGSRFVLDDRFEQESEAETSRRGASRASSASPDVAEGSAHSGQHSEEEGGEEDVEENADTHGLVDGMDPDGFAGPKVVKPLTAEALAVYQAAQNKTGVVYISRIPPGMRPTKVRHIMSQYGEVGRVYLQQEGALQ
jgi:ESF2/ABP1 family protein